MRRPVRAERSEGAALRQREQEQRGQRAAVSSVAVLPHRPGRESERQLHSRKEAQPEPQAACASYSQASSVRCAAAPLARVCRSLSSLRARTVLDKGEHEQDGPGRRERPLPRPARQHVLSRLLHLSRQRPQSGTEVGRHKGNLMLFLFDYFFPLLLSVSLHSLTARHVSRVNLAPPNRTRP